MSDNWKLKESSILMVHNNPSEEVNAEYIEDVERYLKSPVPACNKKTALKLLKQFARKDFPTFWTESVTQYLPAVSEGTMKLAKKVYSHDDAVCHAKALIDSLDRKNLARAFLYGTAHNAPEYRTALACYYYIKNLPEHRFKKMYLGTSIWGDVYDDNACEICRHTCKLSDEPKMQFWHINATMSHFYLTALIPFSFDLNLAVVYLEEYKTLPIPDFTSKDLQFFHEIIAYIESLPEDTTPSKLRKGLKGPGLLNMSVDQISAFIDLLGYLNILHTDDSFGVTIGHTKEREMLPPLSDRSYFAHPVNRWTRKSGIDYDMIEILFGDID
ncbi:MAG: hypothetical protein IJZ02_06080 [Clostridia bacterium]|nr:hypothetical protein [Clostridia bacterium]